jgi:hypothetical protein
VLFLIFLINSIMRGDNPTHYNQTGKTRVNQQN